MVAAVEDGRLVALRPDEDHPLSSGLRLSEGQSRSRGRPRSGTACFTPRAPMTASCRCHGMRRRATSPIVAPNILRRHGSGDFGGTWNPAAFRLFTSVRGNGVHQGDRPHSHYFTSSTQDTSSRLLASQFLYGTPMSVPIPDLVRSDLLVSDGRQSDCVHCSFLTAPRIKDRMHDVVKRGGRVVVIDPRRSETAAQFEWLCIVPDSDCLFLLSLLQVMFADSWWTLRGSPHRPMDWTGWRPVCIVLHRVTEQHTGVAP